MLRSLLLLPLVCTLYIVDISRRIRSVKFIICHVQTLNAHMFIVDVSFKKVLGGHL